MKLRTSLLCYLAVLHLAMFAAATLLLPASPWTFIGAELALAASLVVGLRLADRTLAPLAYTRQLHGMLLEGSYSTRLCPGGSPDLDDLIGTFNAMLARLHEERLRTGERQGLLDRLLEATPSAVVVFDFDGRVNLINASARSMLGIGAHRGMALRDCMSEPGLASALDGIAPGSGKLVTDSHGRHLRAHSGQFFDRGFRRRFLIVEELTEELHSSERATYDRLARVIAHEVNNTVGATVSVLDSLLFYQSRLDERDRADFTSAIDAVRQRNAGLGEFIDRIAHVARMPAPELRPVEPVRLVDDLLQLFREPCRQRGIAIGWRTCDAVPPLPMDRRLMEQALVNIVKNAMEAIPDEGRIAFDLVDEGQAVRLSVIDSGNRLSEVPPGQLFSPFFTTKRGGQGVGLLFVREVLQRHGLEFQLAPDGAGETSFDIRWHLARPHGA